MSHKITGNEKIDEAMQLLVQASCEKKIEFNQYVDQLYKGIKDAENQASMRLRASIESANKHVHERAWTYVAAAGLAGLLLGLFYHRR